MSHHHSHVRQVSHSQNFLHSRRLVEHIVDLAGIERDDLVIEIGAGKGIITDALLRRSDHVLAIEKDVRYVEVLLRRYRGRPSVSVFAADALDFPMPATPHKVFASIPYDITTAIVAKLTSGIAPPDDAFLVVQREAADRFRGRPAETLVSIGLKPWFASQVVYMFARSDFRPTPAVDSVLLRIERRADPIIPVEHRERYRDMVAAIFSAWKPTVEAALVQFLAPDVIQQMDSAFGNALRCRPSRLSFERWIELFNLLADAGDDRLWTALAEARARLRKQQAGLRKEHRSRTSERSGRDPSEQRERQGSRRR